MTDDAADAMGHLPLTTTSERAFAVDRIRAWVRFGEIPVLVEAEACSWTTYAVAIRFTISETEHKIWVWSSAIRDPRPAARAASCRFHAEMADDAGIPRHLAVNSGQDSTEGGGFLRHDGPVSDTMLNPVLVDVVQCLNHQPLGAGDPIEPSNLDRFQSVRPSPSNVSWRRFHDASWRSQATSARSAKVAVPRCLCVTVR